MKDILSTLQYKETWELKQAYQAIEKKAKTGILDNDIVTEIALMLIDITGNKDIDFAIKLITEEICRRFVKPFEIHLNTDECYELADKLTDLAQSKSALDRDIDYAETSNDPCSFIGGDEQFLRGEEIEGLNKEICEYIEDLIK